MIVAILAATYGLAAAISASSPQILVNPEGFEPGMQPLRRRAVAVAVAEKGAVFERLAVHLGIFA
jgi:hypothetical protein